MEPEFAIEARGLQKSFKRTVAVDDVSLSVRRGEIVGFLGPNGAGKTTVMGIIMGLVEPDAGRVALFGVPDGQRLAATRLRIGYLQEKPRIYPDMSARGYLEFFAGLYGIADPARRAGEVLERVGLSAAAERRLGAFSRGMQQRACLARVMLHRPDLLILDEPTLGLDPNGVAEMRAIFRDMRAEGATLLFSSHQLAEMEKVADSVIFMRKGRVIASGRQEDLLPAGGEGVFTVELSEPVAPHLAALSGLPGVVSVRQADEHRIELNVGPSDGVPPREERARIVRALSGLGLTVLSVSGSAPTLEDIFIGLTAPGAREATH